MSMADPLCARCKHPRSAHTLSMAGCAGILDFATTVQKPCPCSEFQDSTPVPERAPDDQAKHWARTLRQMAHNGADGNPVIDTVILRNVADFLDPPPTALRIQIANLIDTHVSAIHAGDTDAETVADEILHLIGGNFMRMDDPLPPAGADESSYLRGLADAQTRWLMRMDGSL